MKTFAKIALAVALVTSVALPPTTVWAQPKKNWTAPTYKIYGQKLVDEDMKKHPELLSITLHGVPPGHTEVYTMFAGSFPERIGNPDDPDDIDVIKKGITILDPRWKRVKDTDKKFVREHRPRGLRVQESSQDVRDGGALSQGVDEASRRPGEEDSELRQAV